jgi:hypothetical protein
MNVVATNLTVANAPLSATYEAAKTALAQCSNIDECQDWADKAEAMASYARQAADETLRKLADRIQERAVRRLGELLKQYDGRGNNQHGDGGVPTQKEAAEAAGVSERQRKTAVRVANVPDAVFETAVESGAPPTVTQLADIGKQTKPTRQIDPDALAALSAINKFADFSSKNNPQFVASAVGPSLVQKMRQKVSEQIAKLTERLDALQQSVANLPAPSTHPAGSPSGPRPKSR